MEVLLGYLLGLLTAALIAAALRQSPSDPPPPRVDPTDERQRRETHNFLHYDGDEQRGE